ncbi:MAG: riboflavin synthase [Dokdonella sp.]
MFTGIVHSIGRIAALEAFGNDTRMRIDATDFHCDEIAIGDSIGVAGVCLTVIEADARGFAADISVETLACTTFGSLLLGDAVNLEKALRFADRIDGHLVSGHVDGIARVIDVQPDARSQRWTFEIPQALTRYVASKGSICIDGVSLTVNEVDSDHGDTSHLRVNLIPHTLAVTTFGARRIGESVNVEVDLLARYIERLHAHDSRDESG